MFSRYNSITGDLFFRFFSRKKNSIQSHTYKWCFKKPKTIELSMCYTGNACEWQNNHFFFYYRNNNSRKREKKISSRLKISTIWNISYFSILIEFDEIAKKKYTIFASASFWTVGQILWIKKNWVNWNFDCMLSIFFMQFLCVN